jgi:hypothetical protein
MSRNEKTERYYKNNLVQLKKFIRSNKNSIRSPEKLVR